MVAGKHHAVCLADGYPAGGFQCLGGFIDEERAEAPSGKQAMVAAHEGGGDDVRAVKEFGIDLYLQRRGTVAQARYALAYLFACLVAAPACAVAHFAEVLADAPQLGVERMPLEAAFVGEGEHLVVHAGGVADTQHVDAPVHQLLRNPVDSGVALGADQHLRFAVQGLVDGFHQRGGLPRSRRTVDDGDIAGAQHLVDGALLRGVQPGEADGVEFAESCLGGAQQDVAQLGETVAFGAQYVFQRLEHGAVGGLIEVELHAQVVGCLHFEGGSGAGHHDYHPGLVGIADGGGEVHVGDFPVSRLAEEADGTTELEAVLDVGVLGAGDFQHQLVQRVVVGASRCGGIPAESALHLAGDTHVLGLPPELLFFVFILHAQQELLALEVEEWAVRILFLHLVGVRFFISV